MSGYYSQEEFDKRMEALKKVYKNEEGNFSLGNSVELKNFSNVPSKKIPSFMEVAEEYIRQNSDNKEILDSFKKMNPLVQRVTIKNELKNILENAGDLFYQPYKESESFGINDRNKIRKSIFDNITNEIDYLTKNATKQDLEFQRYKDIYDVPYWTNKAMNDFLQHGIIPSGYEMTETNGEALPFSNGATFFGKFMTDYKYNPMSEKPTSELFYDKVKELYNKTPVYDRFGKASLAERFANKQALSERSIGEKGIGAASRLLQFPYLNTIEQARQSGAIQPSDNTLPPYETELPIVGKTEIPYVGQNPALNIGEVAFDASMFGSPWLKLSNLTRAGKTAKALNIGMLGEASLKGGVIGGKSALEGEEKAVPTPYADVGKGFATGAGLGSVFYKLGKFVPRFLNKGSIDEKIKNVGDELRVLGEPKELEKTLEETQNVLKSIKTRENMFGNEGLSGINLYARRFREPTDIYSSKPNEIINQAIDREKTHIVGNPVYYGAVEPSPYEVGFNLNSPIQNTPRSKSLDFETPQTIVSEATGYYPTAGVALGAESETRQALANLSKFYAQNSEYVEAMKLRGIDLTDDSKAVENGIRIFNEMNAYLDEPVAEAVIKKAEGASLDNLYNVWVRRNFPNGVKNEKEAKELFLDKYKTAQVNYEEGTLPEKFSEGYIENTNIYNKVLNKVRHLEDGDNKKTLLSMLEKIKTETSLDDISETLSDVAQKAGGVSSSKGNFAAEVRREISPYLVRKQAFENVKGIKAAEKDVAELPQKIKQAKNLQEKRESLQEFKKGYSPYINFVGNKATGVISYGAAKGNTRTLSDDRKYSPLLESQSEIDAVRQGIINYFYDSPLVRMRQKGSFNIPYNGEK